jgi:hypothetical protein
MMIELRDQFILGFHEGWQTFWSPFTGLWTALSKPWRPILASTGTKKRSHA